MAGDQEITEPIVLDSSFVAHGEKLLARLDRIATGIEAQAVHNILVYDETTGRYDNTSIKLMLMSMRNGLAYGVSIPKSAATACTKTGANAGIANPVPGTIGTPAVDPYVMLGPFVFFEVNGGVDADGTPYVTAFWGDGRFTRTGADVLILAATLYWAHSETATTVELSISDTKLAGMEVQPKGTLPSGDLRPYMLYAKYWFGEGDGYSRSGQQANLFDVSHNMLITKMANATTGYSGYSYADFWYTRVMMLVKYAVKDFQTVMMGCVNYNYQYAPSVATTAQNYVVLSKADAANLLVGSTLSIGHNLASDGTTDDKDRWNSYTRDVVDRARVLAIESYDDDNSKVTLEVASTFDCATTDLVSTMPWHTGACDAVEGDGSPTSCTSGKEPFVIQGIETMGGFYEIIADVIFHQAESGPGEVYYNPDSKDEKTAYDSTVYVDTGLSLPTGDGIYPLYPAVGAGGVLVVQGTGGSQTSGLGDCKWGSDFTGDREFLSVGTLWIGRIAGPWFVSSRSDLGGVGWNSGSRASVIGRGVRTA